MVDDRVPPTTNWLRLSSKGRRKRLSAEERTDRPVPPRIGSTLKPIRRPERLGNAFQIFTTALMDGIMLRQPIAVGGLILVFSLGCVTDKTATPKTANSSMGEVSTATVWASSDTIAD